MPVFVALAAVISVLFFVSLFGAPALAQEANAGDVDNSTTTDNSVAQYCTQVQAAFADQDQYGDATSNAGGDGSASVAEIAQDLGISQEAVQNCLSGVEKERGDGDNGTTDENGATDGDTDGSGAVMKGTAVGRSLPVTGGLEFFWMGGILLMGTGLVMLRMVSRR